MTRKFWYILVGGILFAIGCSKSPEQSEETIRELNFSSQITDSADSATTNAPESPPADCLKPGIQMHRNQEAREELSSLTAG